MERRELKFRFDSSKFHELKLIYAWKFETDLHILRAKLAKLMTITKLQMWAKFEQLVFKNSQARVELEHV